MSARVKKHCSLLNYLKHADNDLYELIQELCIGRMLVPRRGTPGIAFLRPDKELLKKIEAMAAGDDPENAVDALQSCVILDHMPTLRDFDDKKSDIPTYRRKKLPVSGVDGKKVTLKNGAEITLDPKFQSRKDRSNITMYVLSKQLVPTDTDDADFSNAKEKNNRKVKGGAEFANTKSALFEQVLAAHSDEKVMEKRDPAMEVLVSLCDHLADEKESSEIYDAVCSQLSWDTLASLAIILRPYAKEDVYLGGKLEAWTGWATVKTCGTSSPYFSLNPDMVGAYQKHMNNVIANNACSAVDSARNSVATYASKVSIIRQIENGFNSCKAVGLPSKRADIVSNPMLAMAEAELRITSAILHDNQQMAIDSHQAVKIFKEKCKLDEPWSLALSRDGGANAFSNIAYYFSSAYLIARSDAFVYLPGCAADGSGLDQVANDQSTIRLDKNLKEKLVNGKAEEYKKLMEDERAKLTKLLGKLPA
jgi:hypothetical protein